MNEPVSPIFDDEEGPERGLNSLSSPEENQDPPSDELTVDAPSKRPGPGFLESVAWTIAAMMSQVIGSIIAIIVIMVLYVASSGIPEQQLQMKLQDEDFLMELLREYTGVNLTITMGVFFVAVSTIVALRLGSHRQRAIPFHPPSAWHIFLTCLWVLPLSLISGQLGLLAGLGWDHLTQVFPSLEGLDGLNVMESIGDIIKDMPPWLVYLLIAVFPAVTEELLFRVLIGRGLVARHGVVMGVALTTLLFAAVHMHPVHMIALLPLSVAIHVSYLSSRSVWIPMLAHFLNNSLAVSVLLNFDAEDIPAGAGEEFLPWYVTLTAAIFCLMIGRMYWQSRQILHDDELIPQPESFVSADRPDSLWGIAHFRWDFPPRKTMIAFAFSMGMFVASMMYFGQQQI